MTDIKFRAWDYVEGRMLEWKELLQNPATLRMILDGSSPTHTALQYTGLKDKNDVEIYVGDWLKCIYMYEGEPSCEPYLGYIKFDRGAFRLHQAKYSNSISKTITMAGEVEIIGNIQQRPKLTLKGA